MGVSVTPGGNRRAKAKKIVSDRVRILASSTSAGGILRMTSDVRSGTMLTWSIRRNERWVNTLRRDVRRQGRCRARALQQQNPTCCSFLARRVSSRSRLCAQYQSFYFYVQPKKLHIWRQRGSGEIVSSVRLATYFCKLPHCSSRCIAWNESACRTWLVVFVKMGKIMQVIGMLLLSNDYDALSRWGWRCAPRSVLPVFPWYKRQQSMSVRNTKRP